MWTTIVKVINEQLQQSNAKTNLPSTTTTAPFTIKEKKRLSSGTDTSCYIIADEHQSFFVKITAKEQLNHLESEAFNLQQLRETNLFQLPKVICLGTSLKNAFLVLSYLNFQQGSEQAWFQFGQRLAQMHQQTSHGQFGWQTDNYIGETLQPNAWQSNWRTFFAEQRIGWQLQLLNEKSIHLGNIDHIVTVCHDNLTHHQVSPCLVHGDLWQGNVGFVDNQAVIFDPACYYGDREVDLAMTELFGRFPDSFYQGYKQTYPLAERYQQRKIIYNFYHILNHANMFGGSYINQAKAMLSTIFALQ